MKINTTLVMGAGSWGTALAIHLSHYGHNTTLWSHNREHCTEIEKYRENKRYLPNAKIPDKLAITHDWKNEINRADMVLVCVPSHAYEALIKEIAPYIQKQGILWATKGFCQKSYKFLHEITTENLPKGTPSAIITGPSFAKEVAQFMPTAVLIASENTTFAKNAQELFKSPTFRSYITSDIIGAQVGGAVKNVLAIATGISDGMGFGANARAGLITRGLAEMVRLGEALGANKNTLMGLSGIGDLILTCTDNQSRNRRYGLALGRGLTSEEANKEIGQVVEGIPTTQSIYNIAKLNHVQMPIVNQMYEVLYNDTSPKSAFHNLMNRAEKKEHN
jgi:glycerol-3-phosphate dehydrogenase (NAD(P)+)